MREELKRREGMRGQFSAAFLRYGWRRGYVNHKTALFVDVRDLRGQIVTDHVWFIVGAQIAELDLKPYERVCFVARVAAYRKGPFQEESDECPAREMDYRLVHYSNMQREGSRQAASLPLFDGQPEVR